MNTVLPYRSLCSFNISHLMHAGHTLQKVYYILLCVYTIFIHFFPESAVTTWPWFCLPFIFLSLNSQHLEKVLITPCFLKHSLQFFDTHSPLGFPDPFLSSHFYPPLQWLHTFSWFWLQVGQSLLLNYRPATGQFHSDILLAEYLYLAQNWMFLVHTWPLLCVTMTPWAWPLTPIQLIMTYCVNIFYVIKPLFPVSSHQALSPMF